MKKSLLFIIIITLTFCFSSITLSHAQQNEWTWMKGSSDINAPAVYGIKGVPDVNNTPRALYEPVQWTDHDGNFWLFGGYDLIYECNTLWRYTPATNEWTWMNGGNTTYQNGTYGTQGIPSPDNTPGARAWGCRSWVDSSGYLWLYGGIGYDVNSHVCLSDLWRYDVTTNEWTWMDGPSDGTIPVSYGTKGVSSPDNSPGARAEGNADWVDDYNRLWLFGGILYFTNTSGGLSLGGGGNDMWMWDPGINEWTWMHGTQTIDGPGVYGTLGVADSANYPPARGSFTHWKDSAGNFYFFGGFTTSVCFNDLWKYDWHNNVFTWVSGSSSPDQLGTYGTQGLPDVNNIPPARFENRGCWQDKCGDFWFYGGLRGFGDHAEFNDLWSYHPATLEWTWISGQNTGNFPGNFGIQGVSSSTNEPPAKYGSVGWLDNSENFWLFGGRMAALFSGARNDLWRYVPNSIFCPNSNPDSQVTFTASDTIVCEKFCIDFTDSSANNPISWEWVFENGTPASSDIQNPQNICYNDPGVFDVMLITTDANGVNDTLLLADFITVNPNPLVPEIAQNGDTLTCSAASSYQWQLNFEDIPGATNQSYTITQSGIYTVLIADENQCISQASIEVIAVGISLVDERLNIHIFPNPSNGIFNIEVSSINKTNVHLIVMNTVGHILIEKTEYLKSNHLTTSIDLRNLSKGIYFLEVKVDEVVMQFKLMRY